MRTRPIAESSWASAPMSARSTSSAPHPASASWRAASRTVGALISASSMAPPVRSSLKYLPLLTSMRTVSLTNDRLTMLLRSDARSGRAPVVAIGIESPVLRELRHDLDPRRGGAHGVHHPPDPLAGRPLCPVPAQCELQC